MSRELENGLLTTNDSECFIYTIIVKGCLSYDLIHFLFKYTLISGCSAGRFQQDSDRLVVQRAIDGRWSEL